MGPTHTHTDTLTDKKHAVAFAKVMVSLAFHSHMPVFEDLVPYIHFFLFLKSFVVAVVFVLSTVWHSIYTNLTIVSLFRLRCKTRYVIIPYSLSKLEKGLVCRTFWVSGFYLLILSMRIRHMVQIHRNLLHLSANIVTISANHIEMNQATASNFQRIR